MKKRWFLVGVMLLVSLPLIGCEGLGWVAKEDYNALQAEHEALVQENTSVKGELEEVQSDLTNLQTDYDTLKGANDKLSADYEAANAELTGMKEVCPPRHFNTVKELQDWLVANGVSDRAAATTAEALYSKALEIQEDALQDGYMISAWIDYYFDEELFYVNCTAVVEGTVWMWNPETDEILNFSDATGLLKLR